MRLELGDITERIQEHPEAYFDAILHDRRALESPANSIR